MNIMRKNDKASNNSHNIRCALKTEPTQKLNSMNNGGQTVITSNRFSSFVKKDHTLTHNKTVTDTNFGNKNSFFAARKAVICGGYPHNNMVPSNGVTHHPHHHSEFHRSFSSGSGSSQQSNGIGSSIRNTSNISSERSSTFKSFNKERRERNTTSAEGSNFDETNKFQNFKNGNNSKTNSIDSNCNSLCNGNKNIPRGIQIDDDKAAAESVKALETLQQIQEAKPGNKRALIVDLPPYLYSIPALASFFEPYGEVAMLQILPQKRMWDADLIDLLGASMCNRLANQSLCAIVEFYSARMAKFIIGILRKRLPILKFRCALLKPSAAIELTNQAENLGLSGVVVMKNKPKAKNPSSDSRNTSLNVSGSASSSSEHDEHHVGNLPLPNPNPIRINRSGSSESGCEEMSSSSHHENRPGNNRQLVENVGNQQVRHQSYGFSNTESNSEHDNESVEHNSSDEHSPAESAGAENIRARNQNIERITKETNAQRFVTSFRINLNR